MKKVNYVILAVIVLCCTSTSIIAQSASYDKTPVIRMGKPGASGTKYISYGELKKNFSQGSISETPSLQDLESFLPLYANYIAKLEQAKSIGYANDETLLKEYTDFGNQAAISYWLDQQIKRTKFEEYYTRTTTEINAKHVLISVPENATPADTLAAYNKLIEARGLFLSGTSMDDLNIQFSSSRQGQYMGGALPWFSVGDMIKSFEDVAYSLKENQISMPFRTQFGYHIVHVDGIRAKLPGRSVSHIYRRNIPSDSTGLQLQKANQAFKDLQNGKDWAETVKEYSEDTRSLSTKGNIGWVTPSSRFHPSLLNAIMELDTNVPFSQPIETTYGYHILRIDSVETYASESERRSKLLEAFDDVPYYTKDSATVFEWVNDLQKNEVDESVLSQYTTFLTQNRETRLSELNGLSSSLLNKKIYTIDNTGYLVSDFHSFVQGNHGDEQAKAFTDAWVTEFLHSKIESSLVEFTRTNFSDFEDQLTNYKNGLIVYKITEDSVWSSSTIDSTLLRSTYSRNKDLYTLPTRRHFHLLSARNDSILTEGIDFINQGNSPDKVEDQFELINVFTDSLNTYDYEPYTLLDKLEEGSMSEIFDNGRRKSVFILHKILPERIKTFEEAFEEVFVDYQPFREERWLERLSNTYSLTLDYKNLKKAHEQETAAKNN